MQHFVQSYNEPRIYNDCDEFKLEPLSLQNKTKSSTQDCQANNYFSSSKSVSQQSNQQNMYEKDNSDEIYSPATESIILSPDGIGSCLAKLNENTSGEEDWIGQETYSYGRIYVHKIYCLLQLC